MPQHLLPAAPNHALQRTAHGGHVFSAIHALRRHEPSLSLSSLGASERHIMIATKPSPESRSLWARLTKLSPKQLDRWARTRTAGKGRYIFLWGICCFGGLLFLGSDVPPALWRLLHHQPFFSQDTFSYVFDPIYYLIGGYFIGAVSWSVCERQFQALSDPTSSPPPGT